jgi:hypothetical protein|tara:strand:- start:440 stop:664 length:225 start_codon:yes stop_codon:yes gene_type:complete
MVVERHLVVMVDLAVVEDLLQDLHMREVLEITHQFHLDKAKMVDQVITFLVNGKVAVLVAVLVVLELMELMEDL